MTLANTRDMLQHTLGTEKGSTLMVDATTQPARQKMSGISDLFKRIATSTIARELVTLFDDHIRPWLGL